MSAGTVNTRHATYAAWAAHVRRRYGRITAFRMGYVIGEASVDEAPPACPWTNPRSQISFRQGFDAARDHLERFGGNRKT
jgi:hypothetical protein